jgi:fucose permease
MEPRKAKQIFLITCISFFTFGLLNASIGPLQEEFAANNAVSIAAVGGIYTALCTGALLAQLTLGPHTDRWGQQRCLAIAYIVLSVFLAAATFSRWFPLTIFLVFIAGMGYGTAVLTGNTLVTRVFEDNSISALNWVNVFFGVGDVAGPLLVSLSLALWNDGMPAVWVGSLGMLTTAVVMILLFFKININSKHTDSSGGGKLKITLFLLSLAAMILIYVGSEGSMGNWITTYLHRTADLALKNAALITAGFWMALTLGRLMGALLGSRLGAVNLLKLCLGISLTGVVLFVLSYGHLIWSIAAVFIIGFGFGAIFPTVFGIMSATYRQNSGKPGSLLTSMASLSGMILPWLVGVTFEKFGMRSMTFFIGGLVCLQIVVFFLNRAASRYVKSGN